MDSILGEGGRLTLRQAAELCGASTQAVFGWVTKGLRLRDGSRLRLAAVRTPARWLVARGDLDAFLGEYTRDGLAVDPPGHHVPAPTRSVAPRPGRSADADDLLRKSGW